MKQSRQCLTGVEPTPTTTHPHQQQLTLKKNHQDDLPKAKVSQHSVSQVYTWIKSKSQSMVYDSAAPGA
jgi:hypothetical protein